MRERGREGAGRGRGRGEGCPKVPRYKDNIKLIIGDKAL